MKNLKVIVLALSALLVFEGCNNASNTTKGSIIGAGGGAALGAIAGYFIIQCLAAWCDGREIVIVGKRFL